MNEYWAFLLVFFGALAICLGGSYLLDGRLRKRIESRTTQLLAEARDNRVREMHMGWGDGHDVEPLKDQSDDCKGCDDNG